MVKGTIICCPEEDGGYQPDLELIRQGNFMNMPYNAESTVQIVIRIHFLVHSYINVYGTLKPEHLSKIQGSHFDRSKFGLDERLGEPLPSKLSSATYATHYLTIDKLLGTLPMRHFLSPTTSDTDSNSHLLKSIK